MTKTQSRYLHISTNSIKEHLNQGKLIIYLWGATTIASFIFVLVTNCFNGDFTNIQCFLNGNALFGICIITLIPYFIVNKLYHIYAKKSQKGETKNNLNINPLCKITWLMICGSILLSLSDYGRLGQGEITMSFSNPISILQAILYKFTRLPWTIVLILSTNSKGYVGTTVVLSILCSILRLSLGGIFTMALILLYKYKSIRTYIKKHWIQAICIILFIPMIVSYMYNLRTQLRHGVDMKDTTASELIFDRLCGRMSSFSNNAITLENMPYIIAIKNQYPDSYLLYDAFRFFGIHHQTYNSMGSIMQREIVGSPDSNYSTMTGFGGMIAFSLAKSPLVLIFNLLFIIFLLWMNFYIPYKLKLPCSYGIGLMCTIWFCTSGDVAEITTSAFGLIIISLYIKLFCSYSKKRVQYTNS